MTITCATEATTFRCPTRYELFLECVGLLPTGRAWQTHDDVLPPDTATPDDPLTGIARYWMAFADVLEHLHQRACALLAEFFCSTMSETRDVWEAEYGYPDACEAYENLCEKVTAVGGANCAYFADVAARRGWSIECQEPKAARLDCRIKPDCNARPDSGSSALLLVIKINRATSPAYVGRPAVRPDAPTRVRPDCGWRIDCQPSTLPLQCLIDRIKPAHVPVLYVVS